MKSLTGTSDDEVGIAIAKWFSDQTKQAVFSPYFGICWFKDEKPVAAALFVNYNYSSVEVHFHGKGCLTRQAIREMCELAFVKAKVNTVITIVKNSNPFKKQVPRIGFKYLAVIPNYFGPTKADDGILYSIQANAASKWIKT